MRHFLPYKTHSPKRIGNTFLLRNFIIALVLFILFAVFSFLVDLKVFASIDIYTTQWLQSHLPRSLDYLFSLFSVFGVIEYATIVWTILVIFASIQKKWLVVPSLFLFWIGSVLEVASKIFISQPAPPHEWYRGVLHTISISSTLLIHYAYPSGHIMRMAFLATILFCLLMVRFHSVQKVIAFIALFLFCFLMIISRLYLAEHWLSDVIGGLLLGVSFGLIPGSLLVSHKVSKQKSNQQ